MTQLTFKGNPVSVKGKFPQVGDKVADFSLVKNDLSAFSLSDLKGKTVVLNTFPSVDTGVCAMQLRTFASKISSPDNTVLLFVSLDLPFAFARFLVADGIDNTVTASDFRDKSMAESYGVEISSGPLAGLYARSVIVIDPKGEVKYSQLVEEITDEPNYDAALAHI